MQGPAPCANSTKRSGAQRSQPVAPLRGAAGGLGRPAPRCGYEQEVRWACRLRVASPSGKPLWPPSMGLRGATTWPHLARLTLGSRVFLSPANPPPPPAPPTKPFPRSRPISPRVQAFTGVRATIDPSRPEFKRPQVSQVFALPSKESRERTDGHRANTEVPQPPRLRPRACWPAFRAMVR